MILAGVEDSVIVTATANGEGNLTAISTLVTTSSATRQKLYLSILVRNK